ncbi:MAG: pyruvate kinase [Candidatus Parcubacteria bacterium]
MRLPKNTKIVCTIGPASNSPEMLIAMIDAGMDVCRLNFSHGTYEQHAAMIATIRKCAAESGRVIALLQDLQGPKIRVGSLPNEGVQLTQGTEAVFSTAPDAALPKITVSHAKLHEDVKPGDVILLDDGLLEVKVLRIEGHDIVTQVVNGGILTSHKGFNLPTASLSIPAITEKDREDLIFGVAQGVDFIALSFVRSAKDVEELRALIADAAAKGPAAAYAGKAHIRIISKVEKHEALKNMDEIIAASDAIMVARGDLGIETPAAVVPLHQKRMIRKCRAAGKPVIVATQMLDSMIRNPRPTRAEVSDVANAVIDHTDAVMLSGESASGKFPLEAVQTMADIVMQTEASEFDDVEPHLRSAGGVPGVDTAISETAAILAKDAGAKCIVALTEDGRAIQLLSRERPQLPIIAACTDARVMRQMALVWGVGPIAIAESPDFEAKWAAAIAMLKERGALDAGDTVIIVRSWMDRGIERLAGTAVRTVV